MQVDHLVERLNEQPIDDRMRIDFGNLGRLIPKVLMQLGRPGQRLGEPARLRSFEARVDVLPQ